VVLCAALVAPTVQEVTSHLDDRDLEQAMRAEVVRAQGAMRWCAFDAADLLLADRLPSKHIGTPALVDSYGQQLLDAIGDSQPYSTVEEAFKAPSAQRLLVQQLGGCDGVSLGARGLSQLDAATKAWLEERFVPRGQGVWVRRATGSVFLDSGGRAP
jgi:hypothetical protein